MEALESIRRYKLIILRVYSVDIFEYLSRLFKLKYNKIWTFSRIRSSMF